MNSREGTPSTKHCPDCMADLPIEKFYHSGRTISTYCKPHKARRNALDHRRRTYLRKGCILAKPAEAKQSVREAIVNGARSQRSIRKMTHLTEDCLTDALADLWADGELNRKALRAGVYVLGQSAFACGPIEREPRSYGVSTIYSQGEAA